MVYGQGSQCVRALAATNFQVRSGSFTALVGPSGCGKSTLLMMLAGMLQPTSGEVLLNGSTLGEASDQIGLALQSPALLPWKTVLDNVMLGVALGIRRRDRGQYVERASELLRVAGLDRFRQHFPRELSGGMRQRVAIVRSLLLDPPILLMDEPFVALDALTREGLNVWFENLWQRTGKAVVWVTHSIDEAVTLADEVVVMSPGPGRIIDRIAIGLPRPRDAKVMAEPAFAALCGRVRECLGAGVAAQPSMRITPGD